MIMVSIINSLTIIISVALILIVHKIKRVGRRISMFMILALLLFYYYLILAISSGQTPSQSNSKIYNFFLMVGIDFIGITSLIAFFKMKLAIYAMKKGTQNKIKTLIYIFTLLKL